MMRLCPSLLYPFDVFFSYLPAIYIFLIYYFFISNFLTPKSFYIGVQMINNVLVVSGEESQQWGNSVQWSLQLLRFLKMMN